MLLLLGRRFETLVPLTYPCTLSDVPSFFFSFFFEVNTRSRTKSKPMCEHLTAERAAIQHLPLSFISRNFFTDPDTALATGLKLPPRVLCQPREYKNKEKPD